MANQNQFDQWHRLDNNEINNLFPVAFGIDYSPAMSELGHSRPKWTVHPTSGLPPLATELRTSLEVRFVPSADIAAPRPA